METHSKVGLVALTEQCPQSNLLSLRQWHIFCESGRKVLNQMIYLFQCENNVFKNYF